MLRVWGGRQADSMRLPRLSSSVSSGRLHRILVEARPFDKGMEAGKGREEKMKVKVKGFYMRRTDRKWNGKNR